MNGAPMTDVILWITFGFLLLALAIKAVRYDNER